MRNIIILTLLGVLVFVSRVGAQTVSESPNPVAIGASLTATWGSVSGPTVTDWVALYPISNTDQQYVNWFYDSSCSQTAGTTAAASGSCMLTVPTTANVTPGSYNLRLFANNGFTKLATSSTFTVTSSGTLSESPDPVALGNNATGSFSGVSPNTVKDWIGIFPMNGDDHSYLTWLYDSSCTQTAGTTALSTGSCAISTTGATAGNQYNLRLFANDGFTKIATSMNFTVGSTGPISFVGRSQQNANTTGANVTVSLPSGTNAGDFVVAEIASYNSSPPIPAGWTLKDSFYNSTSDHLLVIYKLVASGETAYTFGPSDYPKAVLVVSRGAQSIDAGVTATAAGVTTLTIPALPNTATANEMYIGGFFSDLSGSTAVTGPSDLTNTCNTTQWGSCDGYKTLGVSGSSVPAETATQP